MDSTQTSSYSPNKKEMLSIGQASEYLGVSIDTLRRWEKKGKIDSLRSPGGHRYYEKGQLDSLFGKKYERTEPTVRSTKATVPEEPQTEKAEVAQIEQKPELPREPEIQSNPSPEPPVQAETNTFVEQDTVFVIDRPVRSFEIPSQESVRVAQEEIKTYVTQAVTSNESVLTPPQPTQTVGAPPPPPPQPQPQPLVQAVNQPIQSPANNNKQPINISLDKNKLLVITAVVLFVVLVIIVLFIIRSSRDILSPIP